MAPFNLKQAALEATKKEARMEKEAIVEEFLHEYHHGPSKSGLDLATVFWIIAFIIGAGAVLLIKNYYYPGPILPAVPGFGSIFETSQPDPTIAPSISSTPTIMVAEEWQIVWVVKEGQIQAPAWEYVDPANQPSTEGYLQTQIVCETGSFTYPTPAAKSVYMLKPVTFNSGTVLEIDSVSVHASCTLGDTFTFYAAQ